MYLRLTPIESYGAVQPQEAQAVPSSEKVGRISRMYYTCLSCAYSPLSIPLLPLLER